MTHIIYISIIFISLMLNYVQYKLREYDRNEYKDLEECFENLSRQHSKTADELLTSNTIIENLGKEIELLRRSNYTVDLQNKILLEMIKVLRTKTTSLKARLQPYSETINKVDRRKKK